MPFTSQQFADAIAGLRSNASGGRGRELRSTTRIEVNCKVVIWSLGEDGKPGEGRTVLARDLSLGGIGFLTSSTIAAGERLIVGLPRLRQQPLLVRYTAQHCRELADEVYAVGAVFESVIQSASPAAAPAAAGDAAADLARV